MQKFGIGTPALVAVLASFLACDPPMRAQEKPYQGQTIRVGCQSSQWANVSKQMAPDFTKETGITVQFEDIPFSVEYEKLKTAFVAGSVPYDLIWYDSMFTPEFSKQGWLQELDRYLADKYLTPADFNYPDDFYGVTYSGRYTKELADLYGVPTKGTFGIPWIAGFNVLYYRTDLMDAANVKGPPFTTDELLQAAQKLNDPAKGVYGFVMSAKRDRICYDFSQYLWTFGGDFFDSKFKPIFNSDAGVKALEYYLQLGKVAPPGTGGYHITEAWASYMEGHAAFAWTWQDLASVAREKSHIIGKFKCAPPPTYNGVSHPLVGGIVASIPVKASNPKAAFKFITWCQSPANAKRATLLGATTQRASTWEDPEVKQMYPSAEGDLVKTVNKSGRTVPLLPEWAGIDQIIAEQLSMAFTGQKSARDAL
ncbi:MAG: sugar ABC transporter substrate-binding protein, partial [Verrucomicrobia bacterium]|nr:sugar ABC transporter substrate-binding protein [Verrucomicrobiota bacterium]